MTTTLDLPKLEGFEEHYGIQVSTIGEDGDLVALGHHSERQTFAAMRAYSRAMFGVGGPDNIAEVKPKFAVLATGCEDFNDTSHDPLACSTCRDAQAPADWWMRVSATSSPDSFPVMHWSA